MRSTLLLSLLLPALAQAQYSLVKEYIGERFFDDWNFYNNSGCSSRDNAVSLVADTDPALSAAVDNLTQGDVLYVFLHVSELHIHAYIAANCAATPARNRRSNHTSRS